MCLQLTLIQRGIKHRIDFKSLPIIQQNQLSITLYNYYRKQPSLGKILTGKTLITLWSISRVNNSQSVLYDFWEIDEIGGTIFLSGTLRQEAVMSEFKVSPCNPEKESSISLCDELRNAERIEIDEMKFKVNGSTEVADFNSTIYMPDSIAKWRGFLKTFKVSESFINNYSKYFDKKCWEAIGQYSKLSTNLIRCYGRKLGWKNISQYQLVSEDLIKEFQDEVDWKLISLFQKLSDSFLREFSDKVCWEEIPNNMNISTKTVSEFKEYINFYDLNIRNLDRVHDFDTENLNWFHIINNLKIDEAFIRKYWNRFDYDSRSSALKKCPLSTNFINEYAEQIDWSVLSENSFITDEQLMTFKNKFDENRLSTSGRPMAEDLSY